MNVLQVVSLIDPSNSYGGPVRVSVNQTQVLRNAGHDVELIAAARGFERPLPRTYDGASVRLFPAYSIFRRLGFSGLFSPRLLIWIWVNIRRFDVVHIHLARDLIVLPAAWIAILRGVPLLLQTHGMVDVSHRKLAQMLDKCLTFRVLRSAKRIFALTDRERKDLLAVYPPARNIFMLPNGIPQPEPAAQQPAAPSEKVEVLYMARLHKRKRPEMFLRMAELLGTRYPATQFRLVGPDEGEGSAIKQRINEAKGLDIEWEGAVAPDQTGARLRRASMYVLPSVDEPFPMSVLEAMANGLPSVVTRSCGLADALEAGSAGIVCDETLDSLVNAVETLLKSEDKRVEMGIRAASLAANKFTMEAVGAQLVSAYAEVAFTDERGRAKR